MTTHTPTRAPTERNRQPPKWEAWHAMSKLLLSVGVMLVSACGGGGSSTSPPTIDPPVITAQPSSLTLASGASASFSVAATGVSTLRYQWSRNGAAIAGATGSTYTTGPTQPLDNGASLSVAVANSAGTVTSAVATLTVAPVAATAATDIATGAFHSLALKSNGSVWAWGGNGNGQLGIGASVPFSFTPSPVLQANGAALTGIVSIAAGDEHSFAIRSDGQLLAWGFNNLGQLGDGTVVTRAAPVQVLDSTGHAFGNVAQAGGGQGISAALRLDGTVWVWGYYPGLTNLPALHPLQVFEASGKALTGVTRIAV